MEYARIERAHDRYILEGQIKNNRLDLIQFTLGEVIL
jgi:hypothetical protein